MSSGFQAIPTNTSSKTFNVVRKDEICGIGSCTPRWLQRFADPKVYLLIFCALGILQGAYFTYFIGIITTLEKRYAFESKVTGVIMIADNLSPIFTSLLFGYYGGKANKPKLIAGSMILVIISCFASAIPYFIYGPGLHILSKSVDSLSKINREYCDLQDRNKDCDPSQVASLHPAVIILFIANFLNGFGYTAFYTVGAPYLDDNVKKKNSPLYFTEISIGMNGRFESVPTDEVNNSEQPHLPEQATDEQCGIGRFKPKWLQKFADPKVYLVIFCILGVLEGAYFTYFVGILSTLEKRFAFESKISGVILIADNISATFISMLVGFYGGKGHKPRMIAFGMILVVVSCFLSTIPYFMYGPALHLLSRDTIAFGNRENEYCDSGIRDERCENSENKAMLPAVSILFIANFLNGFGYTAYYTIGAPYLDDNVKKKNSPMYFSAMAALRIFGPALGFLLSSFCLKYYEDPFYDPGIDAYNPRWVGAWWLGFFILGFALLIFTLLLALFPRQLPERFRSEKKDSNKDEEEKDKGMPKIKDFPRAAKRLMKNPILVCHVISITFQVNGFAGYFVFMPKFMEAQYQQSASDASLFSGATGIISMLVGILLGGFLIKKYKPRPRYLTAYMVIVEIFSVVGLMISIFLGCPPLQMPGTSVNQDETLTLYNECNAACGCTRRVFEPVCGADGVSTFFSPCFAGCPNLTGLLPSMATSTISTISNSTIFQDCNCVAGLNNTFENTYVTSGFCSSGCNMFIAYIIMLCISKFISSTARVGNTLITFRCVDSKDKSFALGAFGSVLAMFAFIPYPLIYGALTDSTCLVWEESCSKTGNCWLYDSDKFRFYLHGMSMLLISIGICFDVIVFLLSDRMTNFYGEEDEKSHTEDRLARWIKEEEEEDVIFTKGSKSEPVLQMGPII